MRRIKYTFIGLVIFWAIQMIGASHPAAACSGPGTLDIDYLVDFSDVIVQATIFEADDWSQNYILQVKQYVTGGPGPEFLLFSLNSPTRTQGIMDGYFGGGDCSRFYEAVPHGTTGYFFLDRQADGSYFTTTSSLSLWLVSFDEPMLFYEYNAERGTPVQLVLDEPQFLAYVAKRSSVFPISPDSTLPYPRLAPLLIKTATGSNYLFPIDMQPPILLEEDDIIYTGACITIHCKAFTPNRLYSGRIDGPNFIAINTSSGAYGDGFLFSPTSDAIAIWNPPSLEIRYLRLPRDMPYSFDMLLLNQRELNVKDSNFAAYMGLAVWTPDGRFLAFSDAIGLWHWDVYTPNAIPTLLIQATDDDSIPTPLSFSPGGRYLAYEWQGKKAVIDVISGEQHPFGVVSPDDRTLLFEDTEMLEHSKLRFCMLTPDYCNDRFYQYVTLERGTPIQLGWKNSQFALAVICTDLADSASCRVEEIPVHDYMYPTRRQGYAFAYNESDDSLAIVTTPEVITINDIPFDLSASLDGDLVTIEWLPSMFYFVD
ncbi:MAG: hypothetical protein BroJett018_33030 [Chloroflexota bacterium]|nr:MAG: hypothetical protein BroJett018_33030 [Chloroflexota bacterium]